MASLPAQPPHGDPEPDRALYFPSGLYGFRHAQRFAVLPLEGAGEALKILQSLDDPDLSFLLAAPQFFFPQYDPRPEHEDLVEVRLTDPAQGIWMLVVTIPDGQVRNATANLRAPLLINPFARLGKQVILREERPLREPLFRQ